MYLVIAIICFLVGVAFNIAGIITGSKLKVKPDFVTPDNKVNGVVVDIVEEKWHLDINSSHKAVYYFPVVEYIVNDVRYRSKSQIGYSSGNKTCVGKGIEIQYNSKKFKKIVVSDLYKGLRTSRLCYILGLVFISLSVLFISVIIFI